MTGHEAVPALPKSIPAFASSLSGLALRGGTSSGPFLIEGERALVTGDRRLPAGTFSIDGTPRLSKMETDLGTSANFTLFPGVARREFVGPPGTCLETIVVSPTLPFVVVQWGAEGGLAPERIAFDLATPVGGRGFEAGPSGLVFGGENGNELAIGVIPEPDRIEVSDVTPGGSRVTIRTNGRGPVTLMVAAGRADAIRTAFAAAPHLPGHILRGTADPNEEGLVLATGVAEIDEGVAWSRARLRGTLDRLRWDDFGSRRMNAAGVELSDAPTRALTAGLAALAVGDRDGALRALLSDGMEGTAPGGVLAARLALVYGDASHALRYARSWLESDQAQGPTGRAPTDLQALARRSLADGLRHSAPESLIAELMRSARVGAGAGRSLPMVRAKTGSSWATWLASLLAGEPTLSLPAGPSSPMDAVHRTTGRFRTDPDAAWIEWRRVLSAGLAEGPRGPGTWDPAEAEGPSGSLTAELLLAVTQGLLGIEPDAPVGRIRIAPRLPSHLKDFTVRGMTVGDVSLELRFMREGSTHHYVLEPEFGAVPPLVVFEPAVRGPIREVRVDGEVADLALRDCGSLTVVPLQIPVDGPRSVEITVV